MRILPPFSALLLAAALLAAGLAPAAAPAQEAVAPLPRPAGEPSVRPLAAGKPLVRPLAGWVTIGLDDLERGPEGTLIAPVDLAGTAAELGAPVGGRVDEEAAAYLSRLLAAGTAAGPAGLLYDNRDRGHSSLDRDAFPGLSRVLYASDLRERHLDLGLGGQILFTAPTFGNSSTAITAGLSRRSLPRLAMTDPGGPLRAFATYASDHVYVYPEHRDHDAVDLYPANWPYMLISQGSSGSDRPILRALGLILSALPPETRARLDALNLLAPTVQMVFRRAQTGVRSRAGYLSPDAHPTVFDAGAVAPARMMALAQSLRPEDIPPMVRLAVEDESFADAAGLARLSERLFDTPSAIARIWRAPAFEQTMTLSAGATTDPNGRPLRFEWVLLRGDPGRVRIEPLDATGTRARLVVDWHDRRPLSPRNARLGDRVDIGVFADNGVHLSAPAFVSISFPTHQLRRYEPGPDGGMELGAIDYDALGRDAAFDPLLHWSAPWRDMRRADGTWVRITAEGTEPLEGDGSGLGYELVRTRNAPPVLTVAPR